jgi:hypothetical protein
MGPLFHFSITQDTPRGGMKLVSHLVLYIVISLSILIISIYFSNCLIHFSTPILTPTAIPRKNPVVNNAISRLFI